MKMSHIHEALLTESASTIIFVDFDETIGHINPKEVGEGVEVIEVESPRGMAKVAMRHGWKEFLHALNGLDHNGDVKIYSGGGGQLVFPVLLGLHKDLSFVSLLKTSEIKEYIQSHPHSILIDENLMEVYTAHKLKRVGLTIDNLVQVKPFRGQMDNELASALQSVKQKIRNLETKHKI